MSEQVWPGWLHALNAFKMPWFRFKILSISLRLFFGLWARQSGVLLWRVLLGWVAKQYSEQKSPE